MVTPSSTARILIAGQAPGTKVHLSGAPFTDASGDRLRDWLGVSSETFYDPAKFAIVPMGFCFPGQDAKGGDLPPRRECAPAWRGATDGADAAGRSGADDRSSMPSAGIWAPSRAGTLTDTVADWRAVWDALARRRMSCRLPHPSWRNTGWIKQNPWFETELLPFLKAEIQRRLG